MSGICAAAEEKAAPAPRVDAVITGRVEDSRMMIRRRARSTLFYVRLKVAVETVESGHAVIRGARELDLRCWREGGDGQIPIPADGARFRASIVRLEEGYWVPSDNGVFSLLDGSAARVFPEVPPHEIGFAAIVGGVCGLLALVATAFLRYRGKRSRDVSWSAAIPESRDPEQEDRGKPTSGAAPGPEGGL
ncbi:MAG: hypothetical protein KGR69_11980 [Verrucomicrobia bacterium]|nr:hypothetical protein [Verrucomicrobiota bacterium]